MKKKPVELSPPRSWIHLEEAIRKDTEPGGAYRQWRKITRWRAEAAWAAYWRWLALARAAARSRRP